MKKRIISLILTTCMLLSLLSVFATATSAAEADTGVDTYSDAGTSASYIDLYVKDGLVALFDAYSMTASDEKLTAWRPLDLNGEEGYDDYLPLSEASGAYALSSGKSFEWRAADGYLKLHRLQTTGDFDAYLNANVIAAQLGDSWSVQEVARQSVAPLANHVPVLAADGVTVSNLSSATKQVVGHYKQGVYGMLYTTQMFFFIHPGNKIVSHYIQSTSFDTENNASNLTYASNVKFNNAHYMGERAAAVSGYVAANGDKLDGFYLGDGTMATVERTVTRHGTTESEGVFTVNFSIGFHFATPSPATNKLVTSSNGKVTNYAVTTEIAAAANLKSFLLLRDCAESNYSIRIYNKVLSQDELNQNHLADLVAFYGADADTVLSMTPLMLSQLVTSVKDLPLDDRTPAVFAENKAELEGMIEDIVDAYENEADASKKTVYDELYIGADGSKTANGGSLVALYTAYGQNDTSVDIEHGIWFDKMGSNHATVVGGAYDATANTSGWKYRPLGGFGYDLSVEYGAEGSAYLKAQEASDNVITFAPALVMTPDFTVEYVASFDHLQLYTDGVYVGEYTDIMGSHWADFDRPSDTIGLLVNAYARGGCIDGDTTKGYRGVRWLIAPPGFTHNTYGAKYGWNGSLWGDSRPDAAVYTQTVMRDESAIEGGEYQADYTLYKNTKKTDGATYYTYDVTEPPEANNKKNPYFKDAEGQEFKLFSQTPASVYAVRVYDATLTASEMLYNRFIDLAAYAGADLTAFKQLEKDLQMVAVESMGYEEYSADTETFNLALASLIEVITRLGGDNLLYVTRGLTVLLAAYDGYATDYTVASDKKTIWMNGVGDEPTFATLEGTGWTRNVAGGFTIVKTVADYNGTSFLTWKERFGLTLDGSMIPSGEYTVELVANPVGITELDGTRHIDDHSPTGTFNENGFAIGPLRALQFSCYRSAGNDGQMERRWVYGTGNTPNQDSGWKTLVSESHWQGLGLNDVVTLRISLSITANQHTYSIRQDRNVKKFSIATENVILNENADNMFRLMHGVAGTIYSARVYDRVLSEAELAQNRMADLIYYYDVDAAFVADILAISGGAIESLTDAFGDMDFTLDKRDAQEIFNARLTSIWLRANGYSVRADLKDGLRYYFDISESALNSAAAMGLSFEVGAVINVGKNALPVIDQSGYDYKIVAYDDVMGKENNLFVDEDTFAVTVRYHNAEKAELIKNVSVRGYIKITDRDGNVTVFYTKEDPEVPKSMFDGYYRTEKAESPAYIENSMLGAYVAQRIEQTYSDAYVYLDAAAGAGGNGSKDTPFATFSDAFDRCKELLRTTVAPTRLYLEIADGRYAIHETEELLEADKPYAYTIFTVISESGNAVLTTAENLDASKFVLEGDNIYSYQMEKDENGEYPAFRCLYVNDTMSELALNGSYRHADETRITYRTAFHRDYDGIAQMALSLKNEEGYDFTYVPSMYEGRDDLVEHFALYRDQYIAHNDIVAILNESPESLVYGMTAPRASDPNCTEEYLSAFDTFLLQFIASYDVYLIGQEIVINSGNFKNLTPTKTKADFGDSADNFAIYKAAFTAARDYNYSNRASFTDNKARLYTGFEVKPDATYSIANSKLYMPADMLGDKDALTYYILEGREKMIAESIALVASAEAAVEEAKAILESTQLTFDTLSAALDALEALRAYLSGDFEAHLDSLIASSPTETEADKAILEAYKAVKERLATTEAREALNEQIKAQDEVVSTFRIEKLSTAKTNLQNLEMEASDARNVKYKATHDDLWIKTALTPYRMELHHNCYWNFNILHIEGVDYADYVETVDADGNVQRHVAVYVNKLEYQRFQNHDNKGYKTSGRAVFVRNNPLYLDENNEYYYDAENGKLYLYSDTEVKDYDIGYGTLERMFIIKDVENITFENVQFTATDDYSLSLYGYTGGLGGMLGGRGSAIYEYPSFPDRCAIYLDNCSYMTFEGCRFYNLPCEGIHAEGWNEHYLINDCSFDTIGCVAVRIGSHKPRVTEQAGGSWIEGVNGARDITVTDNYFHTIGIVMPNAALLITKLENGKIQHNTVSDCTASGISIGWDFDYVYDIFDFANRTNSRNVDISYNYFEDFTTETYDVGAIYLPQQNSYVSDTDYYMNAVHHNTIIFTKHATDGQGALTMGIYLDISASNWYVYKNVIAEQSYGAHASETDYEAYGVTEEEALSKRKRRGNTKFIYIQHIDTQEAHNILVEDNFILNVRGESEAEKHTEVYQNYFTVKDGPARNLVERGTVYVKGVSNIPYEAQEIMMEAGCADYKCDLNEIYANNY